MSDTFLEVTGVVIPGHQVASGRGGDEKFPGGTLAMQLPFFQERGLDLSTYYLATLNTSIAPFDYQILSPDWHFEAVDWHPKFAAETFSFVNLEVSLSGKNPPFPGLLYYPHPETKPNHFQPPGVLEIILQDYVEEIEYGSEIEIAIPKGRITILNPNS